MPNKEAILDNIELYSAADLVQYIKDGIVTFEELCTETDGFFPVNIRKEVTKLLEGSEEEDWNKAKSAESIELLTDYLNSYPEGSYRNEARDLIRELNVANEVLKNKNKWEAVDKNSIASLQQFINENPNDEHAKEAKKRINDIQKDDFLGFDVASLKSKIFTIRADRKIGDPEKRIYELIASYIDEKKIESKDLLAIIKEDNNLIHGYSVKLFIENNYITYNDLVNIGIDKRFIQALANQEKVQSLPRPVNKIDKINKLSTEVYFWGIPASGKSTALGALLSVANNGTIVKTMSKDPDCQGYNYMNRLSQIFKTDQTVSTLPMGTYVSDTYEMAFDLIDQDRATHPITCIDMAGELIRCMYKTDANEDLTEEQEEALDVLHNILIDKKTQNRKMHFFVLEYGGEKRLYDGLTQTTYLEATLRYLEKTKVFKTDTDAIFLIVTKADKTNASSLPEIQKILKEYITNNYLGFYNGLEEICKNNEINGGIVEIIPFSLGEVCFQDYCLFNQFSAENVLKKIISRTKSFKNGKFQTALKWFKK